MGTAPSTTPSVISRVSCGSLTLVSTVPIVGWRRGDASVTSLLTDTVAVAHLVSFETFEPGVTVWFGAKTMLPYSSVEFRPKKWKTSQSYKTVLIFLLLYYTFSILHQSTNSLTLTLLKYSLTRTVLSSSSVYTEHDLIVEESTDSNLILSDTIDACSTRIGRFLSYTGSYSNQYSSC